MVTRRGPRCRHLVLAPPIRYDIVGLWTLRRTSAPSSCVCVRVIKASVQTGRPQATTIYVIPEFRFNHSAHFPKVGPLPAVVTPRPRFFAIAFNTLFLFVATTTTTLTTLTTLTTSSSAPVFVFHRHDATNNRSSRLSRRFASSSSRSTPIRTAPSKKMSSSRRATR